MAKKKKGGKKNKAKASEPVAVEKPIDVESVELAPGPVDEKLSAENGDAACKLDVGKDAEPENTVVEVLASSNGSSEYTKHDVAAAVADEQPVGISSSADDHTTGIEESPRPLGESVAENGSSEEQPVDIIFSADDHVKDGIDRVDPVITVDDTITGEKPELGGAAEEVMGDNTIFVETEKEDEQIADIVASNSIEYISNEVSNVEENQEDTIEATNDDDQNVDEEITDVHNDDATPPVADMSTQNELQDEVDTNPPQKESENTISVSQCKDAITSLSLHEKFIENDCQEWIVNEKEPQKIDNTLTEEEAEPASSAEDNETINSLVALEETRANGIESTGDDSIKRKSSVEMEEVDLVEDETFSSTVNPAANDAFRFLITALREKLGNDATNVTDATLRQYICWKPDVGRATDRFRAHDKYLRDNFNEKTLLLSVNPKVCYLLRNGMALAPEELIDKDGSAVMVIRAAKCDLSSPHNCTDADAGRAIFFTIQQMLERKSLDALIGGIVIILDFVGVVRRNISTKVIKMLGDAAGCFPIRIKSIYVVAMPWWFPSGNKRLFAPKLRERIHLLKDKAALSEYIDEDRLLEEDGGIYNFDLQAWISTTLSAEVGMKTVHQ